MIDLKLNHEVSSMNLLSLEKRKNPDMCFFIRTQRLVEKNPNLFLFEKKNSRLNGKIQICVYYEKKKKKGDLREKFRSVFIMKEKYEI